MQLRDTYFSWFIPAATHLRPAVPVFTLKDKEKHTLRTPELTTENHKYYVNSTC